MKSIQTNFLHGGHLVSVHVSMVIKSADVISEFDC